MEPRTVGVMLACVSFVLGAITDMFKRKLAVQGIRPIELIASWCVIDSLLLLLYCLAFDPSPPLAQLPSGFWRALLGSAGLCVVGSVLHATAIGKGGLSSVPFLSFNPAFSLAISSVVNAEMPSAQGIGGVVVLTCGALALAYANSSARSPAHRHAAANGALESAEELAMLVQEHHPFTPKRARAKQPSARELRDASAMMSLVGLCWASASSLEKLGLSDPSLRAHHFLMMQKGIMALPLLARLLYERVAQSRGARRAKGLPLSAAPTASRAASCVRGGHAWMLLLSAAMDTLTVLTYFMSLEFIFVSFSLALKRAGGILLAVVGGCLVFGEAVSSLAWGSILVMVGGVLLVVTS